MSAPVPRGAAENLVEEVAGEHCCSGSQGHTRPVPEFMRSLVEGDALMHWLGGGVAVHGPLWKGRVRC